MDATAMLLHKKYQKQPKDNQQSAKGVKELLNQEQNQIEKQYTDTKQQLYQILQLHNQGSITVATLTPGASPSTSTDSTTMEEKLPYFVARNELTKKCEILNIV